MNKYTRLAFCCFFATPVTLSLFACNAAPPSQFTGGIAHLVPDSDLPHGGIAASRFGDGTFEYWIFTPTEPTPANASLVVFLHGWGAMNPRVYGGWIEFLVRNGNLVVYPRYQNNVRTPSGTMVEAARGAIVDAWQRAAHETGIQLDNRGIAWIGHSFGATLAAKLASTALVDGLPPPSFLFLVEPGGHTRVALDELSQLPALTRVHLITGEDDDLVGTEGADRIASHLTHLQEEHLQRTSLVSSEQAFSEFRADHLAPLSGSRMVIDALRQAGDPHPGERGGWLGPFFRQGRMSMLERRLTPDALDLNGLWLPVESLLTTTLGE